MSISVPSLLPCCCRIRRRARAAVSKAAGDRRASADRGWTAGLRKRHLERAAKLRETMASAPDGSDGRMHPNRLLAALQAKLPPDAIVVADGGDFLSFARVGLSSSAYLDPGPFGCIGVGVPFGIAASLAFPGRLVLVATGDGTIGFNAHRARHGRATRSRGGVRGREQWRLAGPDLAVTVQR